ncbi:hypothetical protein ON010_g9838 [Phytophthora cinnamomi]|nr:hypothetical protein ON010_g9838 [Phytophthora cinnamomi]
MCWGEYLVTAPGRMPPNAIVTQRSIASNDGSEVLVQLAGPGQCPPGGCFCELDHGSKWICRVSPQYVVGERADAGGLSSKARAFHSCLGGAQLEGHHAGAGPRGPRPCVDKGERGDRKAGAAASLPRRRPRSAKAAAAPPSVPPKCTCPSLHDNAFNMTNLLCLQQHSEQGDNGIDTCTSNANETEWQNEQERHLDFVDYDAMDLIELSEQFA